MEVVMSGAAASMSADYSPPRGESPAWSISKESDELFSTPKFQRLIAMMPFTMPSDEDLLDMRVVEKASLHDIRKKERLLPVSEKETFASKLGATRWSKELQKDMEEIDAKIVGEMERLKSVTVLPVEHFHKNKENMAEFLEKKRDIFLAQMSLDTKKAEIRKIEDKIFQREEALRKSENMLVDDSQEFDAFLKQNDEKVQEALRKAEHQARLKQEKVAEASRLQAFTSELKRDLAKYQDQLEDCRKYKDFLVGLTPKDWLDQVGSDENAEEEMFFTKPGQLLAIFTKIEETNLTLMQECQDSEKVLEDIRNKLRETKDVNGAKIASLRSQLEALEASIRVEDEQEASLLEKIKQNMVDRKSEYTTEEITEKVTEVYSRCGFELDTSLGVIHMLTAIEGRIEENVQQLEGVSHEYIEQTEKSREKDRRLRVRAQRLEKARQEQERRALKSLERAQAPVHKRIGKPVMFRSVLVKEKQEEQQVDRSDDENELGDFLARSY